MTTAPASHASKHHILRGIPIVHGFAIGHLVCCHNALAREYQQRVLSEDEVEHEIKRIRVAVDKVCDELAMLKSKVISQIDAKHAEIFEAHRQIVTDVELFQEMEKHLRTRLLNAERIVQDVFLGWENKLRASQSVMIHDRADDIVDVGRRLLEILSGAVRQEMPTVLPPDSVLYAKSLLPSDVVKLDVDNINAIITQEGTQNSHSAILARALDIPFVANINLRSKFIVPGAPVVVDGKNGKIIVDPKPVEVETYAQLIRQRDEYRVDVLRYIKNLPLTIKGDFIKVRANASCLADLKMAKRFGADGIGLYRTELFYMERTDIPTEDVFYSQLKTALKYAAHDDVIMRLLDIGGDKTLSFWNVDEAPNPALGLNGIRLLLKYPKLLQMQLRVFLKLSAEFKIKVLVPMVSLPKDMMEVRRYLQEEKTKLDHEGVLYNEHLELGAMIETPAAVLSIDELIGVSDFFNIGTNDLVQYYMAAGRGRADVSDYYEAGNHLVLDTLKNILHTCRAHGRECCVCGELAGDLNYTKDLLDIGLRNFSVQPALIPYVKSKVLSLSACEADPSAVKKDKVTA